jgi:hypothetical protein
MADKVKASQPFTYERVFRPSRQQQIQALMQRAEDMPAADLKVEAAALGVDVKGARTKDEVTDRVRGTDQP